MHQIEVSICTAFFLMLNIAIGTSQVKGSVILKIFQLVGPTTFFAGYFSVVFFHYFYCEYRYHGVI